MAEFAALLPFADRFAAANAPACYRPGVPEDAYTERWLIANADHIYVPFETISDAKVVYNFNDGPNDPGVYFLFDGDELQYVGQAKAIYRRLQQHKYPWRPALTPNPWFTHYSAIWVPHEFLNCLEMLYIHKLTPPRNTRYLSVNSCLRRYL